LDCCAKGFYAVNGDIGLIEDFWVFDVFEIEKDLPWDAKAESFEGRILGELSVVGGSI
jgi:hypothetical protein